MRIRRTAAALTSAAALSLAGVAMAPPASAAAPVVQGGLVNVNVGDVSILEDVTVNVALAAAANVCGVAVNVLAAQLGNNEAVCDADAGAVAIVPA